HRGGINIEKVADAGCAFAQNLPDILGGAHFLGVDRKALNHYVHDRENLLSIVAAMEFTEAFEKLDIPDDADWRTVALAFAHSNAKGMLAAGLLSDYLRTGSNNAVPFLRSEEHTS